MCYKEFIAYQCGHRSLAVVRPCPLTTAGHNFPVCSITPDKPHYAETMCAACERQLHSRWVLIREWEHRWLHERGVCGCEVTFPGLLTTPRVIGDTPAGEGTGSAAETGRITPVEANNESSVSKAITAVEDSRDGQPGSSRAATGSRIPALFTEVVTDSGNHNVAIRLKSLYAAEWQADHRALHEAEQCSCPSTFTPFQPQIPNDELTTSDQNNLRRWREAEDEQERSNEEKRDDDNNEEVDETTKRIAEIDKVFGKFIAEEEQPKIKLPGVAGSGTATPDNQQTDPRIQGPNNNRQHHNRRYDNRRERGPPSRRNNNQLATPYYPTSQPSHPHSQPQDQPQPAFPSQPANFPYPYPQVPHPTLTAAGYVYPECPPPQTPYYVTPAHPTYSTPATYTDTLPYGAQPWMEKPQPTPGMPWLCQGPGPFRSAGVVYGDTQDVTVERQQQGWYTQGSELGEQSGDGGLIPVGRQLIAPDGIGVMDGDTGGSSVEQGYGQDWGQILSQGQEGEYQDTHSAATGHRHRYDQRDNQQTQDQLPLCGLPIGAGPEGTPHMPSWLDCPLRRSPVTRNTVDTTQKKGEGEGTVKAIVGTETIVGEQGVEDGEVPAEVEKTVVMGGAEEKIVVEDGKAVAAEGEEGHDDGYHLNRPPTPQRRHSAAT